MPTYEYHCDTCDDNFDVVQSFHDNPLTSCPTCGSPVRKVFGNVGIVFKGGGFYKTDSRDNGSAKKSDANKESSTNRDGGSEAPSSVAGGKTSESSDGGTKSAAPSDGASSAPSNSKDSKTSDKGKAPTP